ncbi:type I restriction enzyme HsdR N-terminal domain-containing protein [Elizabethkingia anophelis]|uniref:Uncharacterized protein n=1 Tax=Elizabethkingia anophelis TaxID=1117645 RepID=A0A7Z7LZX2_9FLAO|nr:type I restriction enzyme HsdR N-terminal domain-containing protein [Elizabethkingia anophelis]MCT3845064.1 type I restriction enzyme HsdR N-terminal domain-containing protein [Elizabethkingia anophelis]STF08893.1 Uncharacterised protein [Elizabethkingia anophelis]
MFDEKIKTFISYLVNKKGYPLESILTNTELKIEARKIFIDLAIINNDKYLCAFDFKVSNSKIAFNFSKIHRITNSEVLDFPYFLVFFQEKDNGNDLEFKIFIETKNVLKPIPLDEFPHYKTLLAKANADEKIEQIHIKEDEIKVQKDKKNILRGTAISSLLSMLIASLAIFFLTKNTKSDLFTKDLDKDSLSILISNQEKKIEKINKDLENLAIQYKTSDSSSSDIERKKIDNRVSKLENLFDENPMKIVRMQEMTNQIKLLEKENQNLKEVTDIKITNMNNRIDNLSIWTSGLLFAIFSSIIGFAINAFRK